MRSRAIDRAHEPSGVLPGAINRAVAHAGVADLDSEGPSKLSLGPTLSP